MQYTELGVAKGQSHTWYTIAIAALADGLVKSTGLGILFAAFQEEIQ